MSQTIRHPDILEIVRRDGKVTVEGLAAHFGVTLQTIRKDLSDLAEVGRLERVHGGAVLPSGTTNIEYEQRRAMQSAAKVKIAQACAAEIPNEIALFLGIGTTTEAVAQELRYHKQLLVATNNLNVANILADIPECEVVMTGGHLRRSDGGLVGSLATQTIRQFKFDLAVLGCSALDEGGDILDFDIREVGVNQEILGHSRRACLVADQSKFQRKAPVRVGSLSDVDMFVTDAALDAALEQQCREWGTDVRLV